MKERQGLVFDDARLRRYALLMGEKPEKLSHSSQFQGFFTLLCW